MASASSGRLKTATTSHIYYARIYSNLSAYARMPAPLNEFMSWKMDTKLIGSWNLLTLARGGGAPWITFFFFYFFSIFSPSLSLSFLFYLFVAARTGSQLVKLPHSKLDEFSLAFPALTSSCSALSSPHLLFLSKAKVYKTFLHSTPESYGSLHANKMMGIKKLSTITQSVNFNDVQTWLFKWFTVWILPKLSEMKSKSKS